MVFVMIPRGVIIIFNKWHILLSVIHSSQRSCPYFYQLDIKARVMNAPRVVRHNINNITLPAFNNIPLLAKGSSRTEKVRVSNIDHHPRPRRVGPSFLTMFSFTNIGKAQLTAPIIPECTNVLYLQPYSTNTAVCPVFNQLGQPAEVGRRRRINLVALTSAVYSVSYSWLHVQSVPRIVCATSHYSYILTKQLQITAHVTVQFIRWL